MDDFDEKEEKKAKKEAKQDEDFDKDILPETGLYNLDGHLFYHASVNPLTKAQYKRVAEHGINLRSTKKFTLEESIQIFKNWNFFATENNIQLDKACDYLKVKKSQKHIIKHQEETNFWVKLCHGLPHRSGVRIKQRAEMMMTYEFMKDFDWSQMEELIEERFYQYEAHDELTMQKMNKLLEKGYSSTYASEILDVPIGRGNSMSAKIRSLEAREDQEMLRRVFETALHFGFEHEKLRQYVITNNEFEVDRLRKDANLKEISFKLHISVNRCRDLLKRILQKILEKFREFSSEGDSNDVAWDRMWADFFTEKPPIEEHQLYEALELMCQFVEKEDTGKTLRGNKRLAKEFKSHGITGFQCEGSEHKYLHHRIYAHMLSPLNHDLFDNFRRDFRYQLKLHCLLWSNKRLEVWERILVPAGKTRYEAVLESEMSNPLASRMTLKFLKNKNVVEWITESMSRKTVKNAGSRRIEAAVAAFILYIHRNPNFKFPAKLRHLVTSSKAIKSVLEQIQDPENSEYLTIRQAKKEVEEASGSKISVRVKDKLMIVKDGIGDPESDSEDVSRSLVDHSRDVEAKNLENLREEIENILDKADPSKIRRKYRMRDGEEVEEIWLSEELHRQKMVMRRAAEAKQNSMGGKQSRICSAAFVDTSDKSSSDEEKKYEEEEEEEERIRTYYTDSDEELEGLEDIRAKKEDPEDPEDSEDVPDKKKKKKRKDKDPGEDSEAIDTPEDVEAPSDDPEDVMIKKRKKKKKRRESELLEETPKDPEEDVEDSEDVNIRMRKKKKKNKYSDDMGSSNHPEQSEYRDPDDQEDSDEIHVKKKKKRKHRDSEIPEEAPHDVDPLEAIQEDPDEIHVKKKKKRKHRDSEAQEDVKDSDEPSEAIPEDSEVKKKKKKKKRRHSEQLEDVESMEEKNNKHS